MSGRLELSEFVAQALVDIISGVKRAQKAVEDEGGSVNPDHLGTNGSFTKPTTVHFDVAVIAESSSATEKSGKVSFIKVAEASIDGNSTNRQQHESRIRFEVPVQFPAGKNINRPQKT